MANKADATKQQQSTAPTADDLFGQAPYNEDLDPSDRAGGTSAPGTKFFGIAQNQGTNVEKIKHAGQFFSKSDEGDLVFFEHLDVVILDSGPRSTRFDEDDKVACRSYDGKVGTCGRACKDCEFYFFRDNEIPKDRKCKNSRILLCVPAEDWHAEPFFFQVSPAGIKDWQKYANDLQNRYKRPVFSAVTRLSTLLRQENKGMSYVPVFTPIQAIAKEDVETLRSVRIAEAWRFKAPDEETSTPSSNGSRASDESMASDGEYFLHGAPAPSDDDDPFGEE